MNCNRYVFLRRLISSSVLIFITIGLFGICSHIFLFLSKLQFGQIFLDLSAKAAVLCFFILLLSYVFGRLYCSALCPLGVFQDFAGALGTALFRKKYSFHGHFKFRYIIFFLVVILFLLGVPSLMGILDPYSIYVRGASRILDKVIGTVMDVISPILRKFDIYSSYSTGSFIFPPVIILLLIFVTAFFRGRLFCNSICPVGMILGCVSRASIIRPAFKDNCISCGKCETVCKSECISAKDKLIDLSRCVMCGNCVSACPVSAMSYSKTVTKQNLEKREAIKSLASIALFTALPLVKAKNYIMYMPVLSAFSSRIKESASIPQIPAGAMSWARFTDKCIGCHACIKRCPSKVLQHAGIKYGLYGASKPVLDFRKGFCQYDCVVCGQTCPFGAILPINTDEKHKIQTGIVQYIRGLCVITKSGKRCGACAEHCPTGALEMILYEKSHDPILAINQKLCVGCGACEYICPVIPQKAINVKPHAIHQAAEVLKFQNSIIEDESNDLVF